MIIGEKKHITSDQIYTRFWIDFQKISPCVCPIRDTPHYSFAREILEKAFSGEFAPVPQNSFYEKYCSWEAFCIDGNLGHSSSNYYRHIADWTKNFDILSNLPKVLAFDSDKFFVHDGVHRIAFMAVLIDLGRCQDRIPVQLIDYDRPTVPVEGIVKMENWLKFN